MKKNYIVTIQLLVPAHHSLIAETLVAHAMSIKDEHVGAFDRIKDWQFKPGSETQQTTRKKLTNKEPLLKD